MNENTKFLVDHNKIQSDFYQSPDEVQNREEYKRRHHGRMMVTKCMDGRVNIPIITGIPMGIISPYRSMGAKFEIGSPGFAPHVRNFYDYVRMQHAQDESAYGIVINTYHYSKGKKERGCKGFHFDTKEACSCTMQLRDSFEEVYGKSHTLVHPVCVGVETDEEALVIHGENGRMLDVSEALNFSEEDFRRELRALIPSMKHHVLEDLLPLVVGNRAHVETGRKEDRPIIELDHREQTIAVGRGFDWLHLVNEALIVGPFNVGWLDEVVVAARIVLENLKREPELAAKGATLLASAPYRESGVDAAVARKKALLMAKKSWACIEAEVPELLDYKLDLLVGTLDRNTMLMRWTETDQQELAKAA